MATASAFRSRFRPQFDSKVSIFVATKRIELPERIILPGQMFDASEFHFPPRRISLMFSQRYMDYVEDEKAAEDFAKNPAPWLKKYIDEVAAEAKAKINAQLETDKKTTAQHIQEWEKKMTVHAAKAKLEAAVKELESKADVENKKVDEKAALDKKAVDERYKS